MKPAYLILAFVLGAWFMALIAIGHPEHFPLAASIKRREELQIKIKGYEAQLVRKEAENRLFRSVAGCLNQKLEVGGHKKCNFPAKVKKELELWTQ